jgi:hypothetical protein
MTSPGTACPEVSCIIVSSHGVFGLQKFLKKMGNVFSVSHTTTRQQLF